MKKVTSILFAGLFATALVACSEAPKTEATQAPAETEAPAEAPVEEAPAIEAEIDAPADSLATPEAPVAE